VLELDMQQPVGQKRQKEAPPDSKLVPKEGQLLEQKLVKKELLLLEVRPELQVSKKEVNQEPRARLALPSRRASRKRNSVKSVVRVITKSSALLRHSV
jgi:hypothetical protein